MATNNGMSNMDSESDCPSPMMQSVHDDDFVILQAMTDSAVSEAEKQAFESLEKGSGDENGKYRTSSVDNQKLIYEDNIFLDEQQRIAKKRGFFGETGDGEKDDDANEKNVVEDLRPPEDGSPQKIPQGEQALEASPLAEQQPTVVKAKVPSGSDHGKIEVVGSIGDGSHPQADSSESTSSYDMKSQQNNNEENGKGKASNEEVDSGVSLDINAEVAELTGKPINDAVGDSVDGVAAPDPCPVRESNGASSEGRSPSEDEPAIGAKDHTFNCDQVQEVDGPRLRRCHGVGGNGACEAPVQGGCELKTPLQERHGDEPNLEEESEGGAAQQERGEGEPAMGEIGQATAPQQYAAEPGEWGFMGPTILILVIATGVAIFLHPFLSPTDNLSPQKPTIILDTVKHLPPAQKTSWILEGSCTAYNTSYTIEVCGWQQIHPSPKTTENTVLKDRHDCLNGANHTIAAMATGLKVPTERGSYIFELECTDNTGHKNALRVDIWVNELVPPVVHMPEVDYVISTSVGLLDLEASCRASQGKVESERWDFIDGMVEIVVPPEGGLVKFVVPGKYELKYKCTDSYGAFFSQRVTVTVKPSYVLGIDLGTSTTCVVVIKEDGTSHDIPMYDKDDPDDLDPCMPSVVAFTSDGRLLVGEKAARQMVANPDSTIYEVKRLMGRSYYDDTHHTFDYRVRPTLKSHSLKGVRAAIEIPCDGTTPRLIQPEFISALILRRVVDLAENYLQVPVRDVVISVPAQFDDAQRKATKDAGLIAGLNPIKIVNEPTVAAFASRNLIKTLSDLKEDSGDLGELRNPVLAVVADIGGGTTDYALMQIQGTSYKVLTTDGNKALGGRDIDILLADRLTEIFAAKNPSLDLKNKAFQQKLRIACETTKVVLSKKDAYAITVDYVDETRDPLPLTYTLTRAEFENFVSSIFDEMVEPLKSLMDRSGGFHPESIEELYLVGGTSNIPKLRELLQEAFPKVKKVYDTDPVQLVGRGAAAFGAVLTHLVEIPHMPRVDVTPLPISIAVDQGDMLVIFKRNRIYPCSKDVILSTFTDLQTAIMIKVYEGEGRTADECHFLGEFELSGIPPMAKREPKIMASFEIDRNGILSVKAQHGQTKSSMKIDVYSKSGSMTKRTRNRLRDVLTELNRTQNSGTSSSVNKHKCSMLETASPMQKGEVPPKPRSENVLKLSVDSEYESILTTDPSRPEANLHAMGMVTVKGFVTDYESSVKESDLDIILVIDKSYSMDGEPIDTIKHVIKRLIDVLKQNHRLGIVTFDDYPMNKMELTYFTDASKATAHNIVRSIYVGGETNLYGGLLNGLRMAYNGGRRSRVLLFTDGFANKGVKDRNQIILESAKEITMLSQLSSAQVTLSTFGYQGKHDHELLSNLATNIGGGTYNFLSEGSAMAEGFGRVLGDAINTVAENIRLTVTPLGGVQIVKAITHFTTLDHVGGCDGQPNVKCSATAGSITFEVPSTSNQQARHVLLELAVPPSLEATPHDNLFHVELTYRNTITERDEGGDDYLFVARSRHVDIETRSRDMDEQLNRVRVAEAIEKALTFLEAEKKNAAIAVMENASSFVSTSISKEHTLSLCLCRDLDNLVASVKRGDMNEAKKFLQDSLTSHWQEKGGRSSCYVTKHQLKLITHLEG